MIKCCVSLLDRLGIATKNIKQLTPCKIVACRIFSTVLQNRSWAGLIEL